MSAIAPSPASKKAFKRNLFSRTIIGQKRERGYERQNVPFSYTIDVSAAPADAAAGAAVTAAGGFVTLPDTYLFANVLDDVGGVVVTRCEVGFRDTSAATSSSGTDSPQTVDAAVVDAIFEKLTGAAASAAAPTLINLNLYVLDPASRRALAKPVAVATVPITAATASASLSSFRVSATAPAELTSSSSSSSLAASPRATVERLGVALNPHTSAMIAPAIAGGAKGLAALKAAVAAAAGGSATIVPTVTVSGYIIDTEEEEKADGDDAEAEAAPAVVVDMKARQQAAGIHARRLLLKMGRQSSFTAAV